MLKLHKAMYRCCWHLYVGICLSQWRLWLTNLSFDIVLKDVLVLSNLLQISCSSTDTVMHAFCVSYSLWCWYLLFVKIVTIGCYGGVKVESDDIKHTALYAIRLVVTVVPRHTNVVVSLLQKHRAHKETLFASFTFKKHILLTGSHSPVTFETSLGNSTLPPWIRENKGKQCSLQIGSTITKYEAFRSD